MNELYSLLMRREAKLIMEIELYERQGNFKAAQEARDYKEIISSRRLNMIVHIRESA